MKVSLYPHQKEAISKIRNGCILCGGVGTGKSITALAYYFVTQGGGLEPFKEMVNPKDLYIITTARKRDTFEWEKELIPFDISANIIFPLKDRGSEENLSPYKNKIVIDSWNNIKKYTDVKNAFFIFDEQRVIGSGAWAKSFITISRFNKWILLTATPGDTWMDYVPVFIANGFYRNKSDFVRQHVVYSRFAKYPKVERYVNQGKLVFLRKSILVQMKYEKVTIPHSIDEYVDYPVPDYKLLFKMRWDFFDNKPIENAAELCYQARRIVNSDPSRIQKVIDIVHMVNKAIVFYNYNYELDILKNAEFKDGNDEPCDIAEWNGHVHQPIPNSEHWVYLVQYTAGAEGWNCILTDTIIFYSQNYSYKTMVQASGRIDRLNTPYIDLYFYHLKSRAGIDLAIQKALSEKRNFNESDFKGVNNETY